ncbi:lysophospholipid acyltransferase family protein [Evansella tamaricis]|uniref:Lysophospholipid acyltransferase family protein n=1 Tax=Evansella tamaricis TaxID=2069301 RepID=A0ABS6JM36_9BACI|nr:lysophospholipid acyltransferase family protein [Evansella tamaricis]
MNHSSWWDSIILFYLNKTLLKVDGIGMMSLEGLTRFPFFRKIGAFSVDRSSIRSMIHSLQYASKELTNGKHLFLFPQGEELHIETRPLRFLSGASYLHEKNKNIPIIPITFYHSLVHHQLPEWYIHIGDKMSIPTTTRKETTSLMESIMEKNLDWLREKAINEHPGTFKLLLKGKESFADKLDLKRRLRRK